MIPDDDPWADAWRDAPAPPHPAWPDKHPPAPREADVPIPTWPAGPGAPWNDPSSPVHNSLWSPSTAQSGLWALTHVESGSNDSAAPIEEVPALSQQDLSVIIPEAALVHSSPSSPNTPDDLSHESESPSDDNPPGSPDAFGTFEEAVPDAPWSTADVSELSTQDWASSWSSEATSLPQKKAAPTPDEWELARQEKENRERQLPPEQLAPLLRKAREFAEQVWPTPELSDQQSPSDKQDLNLQGLDDVEGLTAAAAKLIPQDLTLPPAVRFNKTSVAKHMAEAIRLTKHAPLTRLSPLSLSVVPKGSMAWEAAVKAEPDVAPDDAPPGWRILEKTQEELTSASSDVAKGKRIGGLLSFLGRRPTTPPLDRKREISASPAPVPATSNRPASPTRSVQTVKPPPTPVGSTTTVKSVPTPPPVPQPSTSSTTATPSTDNSSSLQPETNQSEAPSAISRFLGRFSRAKGSQPSDTQTSKPLDLSSNDLEFLSDMGSNASDGTYKPIHRVSDSLETMLSSSPPAKLPPPLSPPPSLPTPQTFVGVAKTDIMQPTKTNGRTSRSDPFHGVSENGDLQSNALVGSFSFPPPSDDTSGASISGLGQPRIAVLNPTPEPGPSYRPRPTIPNAVLSPMTSRFPQVMMSQSQTRSSSTPSPALKLPPPPSTRSHTPLVPPPPVNRAVRSLTPVSLIPAPSTSFQSVSQPFAPVAMISSSATQDFDDFSDFHSQAPVSMDFSAADTSFSSVSSNHSLVSQPNQTKDAFDFDDFDDFVSSPIRTPSPPRPPAKTPSLVIKRLPAMPESAKESVALQQKRKASRAAEHSRTLSLVEIAASRPGRWPAPPSPLPPPLPPPGAVASDLIEVNFFGEPPQRSREGSAIVAGLTSSTSSPAAVSRGNANALDELQSLSLQPTLLPPPSSGILPLPTLQRPAAMKPMPSLPAPTKAASLVASQLPAPTSKATGGLSAQDLLFFEGI